MPVQFYRHISLYGPLVSAFPEVPCLIRAGKPQLLQIHLQNSFLLPGIEKPAATEPSDNSFVHTWKLPWRHALRAGRAAGS